MKNFYSYLLLPYVNLKQISAETPPQKNPSANNLDTFFLDCLEAFTSILQTHLIVINNFEKSIKKLMTVLVYQPVYLF